MRFVRILIRKTAKKKKKRKQMEQREEDEEQLGISSLKLGGLW